MARIGAAAVALLALISLQAPAQEPKQRLFVIVSPAQSIVDVSLGDLRRIYLAQITRWPNRDRIVLVVPWVRSPESRIFLRQVVRMAEIDYAHYWIGAVFRGESAEVPLVARSSEEAKRIVASRPDAIAVVSDESVLDRTVRVLTVDGKAPGAAGYPLVWR